MAIHLRTSPYRTARFALFDGQPSQGHQRSRVVKALDLPDLRDQLCRSESTNPTNGLQVGPGSTQRGVSFEMGPDALFNLFQFVPRVLDLGLEALRHPGL